MSDVRARLAEALRKHRQGPGPSCRCCGVDYAAPTYTNHLADVLLSLPGIAIVELPEANPKGQTEWPFDSAFQVGERSSVKVVGTSVQWDGVKRPVPYVRALAAALLAAANAAESVTK